MSSTEMGAGAAESWGPVQWIGAVVLWLWVLVPFGYGLYQLLTRIPALFGT